MSTSRKNTKDTNRTNLEIAQMGNEYNMAMLDKQIQEQWKMWQAENEYNTASAQRRRLEEAGLNPYLMMDGGNAGSASSMTAPAAQGAIVPTMQVPPSGLQDFATFANGLSSILQSAAGSSLQAGQLAGQVQSNTYYKEAYKEQLQALRANREILQVTAGNEKQKQALQMTGMEIANNMAYQTVYGHVLENMKASLELSALPEQLQLGIAHLTTDLKLKKDQHLINEQELKKIEQEVFHLAKENRLLDATFDAQVRSAEAGATAAENNTGSKDWYQIIQKFMDHIINDKVDPSLFIPGTSKSLNPFAVDSAPLDSTSRILKLN